MAGFNIAGIATGMLGWVWSIWFWLVVIFVFGMAALTILIWRKERRFMYPALEVIELGGGHFGINKTKAGWFRTERAFMGLWELGGPKELLIKDGWRDTRKVQGASNEDFNEINFKRGIVVGRKGDDPNIVFPISQFKYDDATRKKIDATCPSEMYDAAGEFVIKAYKETQTKGMQILQMVMPIIITIFLFLSVLVITQMVGRQLDSARGFYEKYIEGQGTRAANVQVAASNAP